MENTFTPEQILMAKECKSADDLLTLAKNNGIDLTEAEAMNLFARLNPTNGELSDDELEATVGGSSCGGDSAVKGSTFSCPHCGASASQMELIEKTEHLLLGGTVFARFKYRCTQCHREFCV